MLGSGKKRILIIVLATVVVLYGAAAAYTYNAMCKSPSDFSEWVNGKPSTFAIIPFRPLWMKARGGDLQVGDMAPDFDLETTDHSQRVRLSEFRGDRPVVLVFGSYT